MVLYGQLVIGAPGSGKTTYCNGMQQYLRLLGRDCWVVNMDPANESSPSLPSRLGGNDGDDDGAEGEVFGDPNDGAADDGGEFDVGDSEEFTQRKGKGDEKEEDEEEEEPVANRQLPYETILDVCTDVVSLDAVVSEFRLGPNGGLLYCMEYIEHHMGEIISMLRHRLYGTPDGSDEPYDRPQPSSPHPNAYLLFDLPGQVELYAHSQVVSRIAARLVRELDLRLTAVQLVDAAVCCPDASKFVSAALVCTAGMVRLELPGVNVLSKMDLLMGMGVPMPKNNGGDGDGGEDSDSGDDYEDYAAVSSADEPSPLPFNLEFFTKCNDLHRLVDYLDADPMAHSSDANDPNLEEALANDAEYIAARRRTRNSTFRRKHRKLHEELCEVIEDYGLLSFLPLCINDGESVGRVVARVDKCNGYAFVRDRDVPGGGKGGGNGNANGGGDNGEGNDGRADLFASAIAADAEFGWGAAMSDVQERYLGDAVFQEEISELKNKGR